MIMGMEKAVADLDTMDGSQLRKRWRELAGSAEPGVSPKLLRLALAYRLQADALGPRRPISVSKR